MDRVDLAGDFARAPAVRDGLERAGFRAEAAIDAKGFIDVGAQIRAKADRVAVAGLGAAVREAAAAKVRDLDARKGAGIAGRLDDFEEVRVALVPAEGELDALADDLALLVDAATHLALGARGDDLRDLVLLFLEGPVPIILGDLEEDAELEFLNERIVFDFHGLLLSSNRQHSRTCPSS